MVPAVSITVSNALSQDQGTITTQATTTELYTYSTSTLYETWTGTEYFYGWQQVGHNSPNFHLNICGQGAYTLVAIDVTQGQRYHIDWTTDSGASLDFYITTAAFPFANDCVLGGNNCVIGCSNGAINNFPDTEELYYHRAAAGSVDWIAPSTRKIIAWLWNLTPQPVSGTFSIQTLFTRTIPSISYATAQTTMLLALTTVYSQVPPTTSPQSPAFQMPIGNLGFLGIIAVVAVTASVLVFARRRKTSVAATLVEKRPTRIQEPPKEAVVSQALARTKTVQSPPVTTRVAEPLIQEKPIVRPIPEAQPVRSEPIGAMVAETPTVVSKPIPSTQLVISTGYKDLDKALEGGLPQGFAVVVASPSYDERDLLLRKIIESVIANGGSAFYISNEISKTQDLFSRFQSGFFAFSSHAGQIFPQRPNLYKIPGIENLSDANISLGIAIRDAKGKAKDSGRVLLIDILSDILLKHKATMTRRWLSDFVSKRKGEGFTVIATLNPLIASKEETESVVDFFDGVIEIHERALTERARRFLLVKKMYGRRYSENELMLDRDKLL
jgi:KaiC/GvpD/RAD55 family RecA-like ATPase